MPGARKHGAAFDYLGEVARAGTPAGTRLRALPEGETNRVDFPGGAYAIEQVYLSKVRVDGFFESHRRFIDVQVVIEGEELMEVADITRAVVRRPYQDDRDLVVYENDPASWILRVGAGDAAVFFPQDVHMPGLCTSAGPALVRKTVVKVPVEG